MDDAKISELPVATSIASPDVAPIVQGGVTKQADVSLFGGDILSANITRVDPSGDDGTGAVGDLSKPFLTVQGAIDAIEAGSFASPVIDTGANSFSEDLTTTLPVLGFVGTGAPTTAVDEAAPSAFQSLTLSGAGASRHLYFRNVGVGTDQSHANIVATAYNLFIYLGPGASLNDISATNFDVQGQAQKYNQTITGIITTTAVAQIQDLKANAISAGTSAVNLLNSGINIILSAGDISMQDSFVGTLTSANSISLIDSRIETNNSGVTPTYGDVLLNPALMDFSTLPTSIPARVGAAWIDTTGGFNIVKVKL